MGGGALARRRAAEAAAAAAEAGIESVVLDIHNNGLEADIPTREIFIRLIREYAPDIIFTHRPWDYHPDHRRASLLVQDSSYAVLIPNVCPLTPVLKKTPAIFYTCDHFKKPAEFMPDVAVAIDDVMDIKIRIVRAHESQIYEWLPWVDGQLDKIPGDEAGRLAWITDKQQARDKKTADRFRNELIARYGPEAGARIQFAEAFERCEYGARLNDDEIRAMFPA